MFEKQRLNYFANKRLYSQGCGLPSGHVQLWELNYEDRVPKNWCLQTVVLEKTLESPLDSKEVKPVNPKGNQPWIFTGRTDTEAEAPIIGHLMWRVGSLEKDSAAGKDRKQKEKGMTEDEMVGWHHWLNGYEFEQTLGDGEGQRSLVCCTLWGLKESDTI